MFFFRKTGSLRNKCISLTMVLRHEGQLPGTTFSNKFVCETYSIMILFECKDPQKLKTTISSQWNLLPFILLWFCFAIRSFFRSLTYGTPRVDVNYRKLLPYRNAETTNIISIITSSLPLLLTGIRGCLSALWYSFTSTFIYLEITFENFSQPFSIVRLKGNITISI